jgi:protein TonB
VTEESGAALAPSTVPNASAEASPGVSSAAPIVAALPPGEPSRSAIPRGGYQVTPTYPATARRLGLEGTALLGVLVDAKGRVGEVVVRRSAGHPDLDRAAADAIKQWQFEPARRGKEAIAMWVEVPVHFRLR